MLLLLIWMTQLVVYGGLAVLAARGRDALVNNPSAIRLIGRASGVLLLLVSALTLWRGLGGG